VSTDSFIEYFPFWEKTLDDLPQMLRRIVNNLIIRSGYSLSDVDKIAVAMTAELSDAFQTKKEGVRIIMDALKEVFDLQKIFLICTLNKYISFEDAASRYELVAAANWVSTALYLGGFESQCILIDAGSTTIDVIPIVNSVPVTTGKTDIERLMHHELIYTGGLRATIPSIIHHVPYKGKEIRISFEKFALISDVHRILNNISEEQYINDTADNRSKSLENCYARLARVLCMDLEEISKQELDQIAVYIYNRQIKIISTEMRQFMTLLSKKAPELAQDPKFVITGLSGKFLIRNALEGLGFNEIHDYEKITGIPDNVSSSAHAVAGALFQQLSLKT